MSERPPVELSGQDTNIEIEVSQGEFSSVILLTLADYTVPTGYETNVLALIEAGRDGNDFLYRTDGTATGTLSDGELAIDDLNATISRIRDREGDGSVLQLNRSGAGDIGAAFSTGGSYEDGVWDIQTVGDSFSVDLSSLTFGNAPQLRYAVPAAGQSILAGLGAGSLFILALRTELRAELDGQDTNIEIDVSQGTLDVQEAARLRCPVKTRTLRSP